MLNEREKARRSRERQVALTGLLLVILPCDYWILFGKFPGWRALIVIGVFAVACGAFSRPKLKRWRSVAALFAANITIYGFLLIVDIRSGVIVVSCLAVVGGPMVALYIAVSSLFNKNATSTRPRTSLDTIKYWSGVLVLSIILILAVETAIVVCAQVFTPNTY